MTLTVDVALYNTKPLTVAQQKQLEQFLSDRWKYDVKIGLITTVAFDLVATKDAERDYSINMTNIARVLGSSQVLVIGDFPLHTLKALVSALQSIDTHIVPYEVFTVVNNYKGEFQRFSHMNLYRRDVYNK